MKTGGILAIESACSGLRGHLAVVGSAAPVRIRTNERQAWPVGEFVSVLKAVGLLRRLAALYKT
jgi:hypothetical protein